MHTHHTHWKYPQTHTGKPTYTHTHLNIYTYTIHILTNTHIWKKTLTHGTCTYKKTSVYLSAPLKALLTLIDSHINKHKYVHKNPHTHK